MKLKPLIPVEQLPCSSPLLEGILTDIAVAAASTEEAANAFNDAGSKVSTDAKAAEIALESAASKLQLSVEKLTAASTNIGFIAPLVPEEVQETVQAIIKQVTDAKDAASTAKNAVGVTKDKVGALIEAQNAANAAAAALTLAIETATKVDNMLKAVEGAITTLGTNMAQILGTIKVINPTAKVYVMGYYNAMPYLPSGAQEKVTIPILLGINEAIEIPAQFSGATYVPTFQLFEGNKEKYLPNPLDIHPNEAGYRALADGFMKEIRGAFPGISEPEEPSEQKIKLEEKVKVSNGQLILIDGTSVALQLPDDLPEGTMLTVTATNKELLSGLEELVSIGDALNFEFHFPEGDEDFKGEFKLVMGYDAEPDDEVDIYYYNEAEGVWESQSGDLNEDSKQISLTVSHFSNYGVFAKEETEATIPPKEDDVDPPVTEEPKTDPKDDDKTTIPEKEAGGKGTPKTVKPITKGDKLPNTATNNYNSMLAGLLFLASGLITSVIARKRRLAR